MKIFCSFWLLFLVSISASAETFTLSPADAQGDEELENVLNALQPGDEVILMDGEFSQTARRAVTIVGTRDNPIVIRAADGANPIVTRPANQIDQQNNIEIESSRYVEFRGIHFRGGSIGVRFMGNNTAVTLEDCEISMTGSNALSMNTPATTSDQMVVRRTHIHDTGLAGNTEGEGMYIGCNDGQCTVRNSVFENNYIHDLRGMAGGGTDGIEIKPGSHDNLVKDNVIHDVNLDQQFPCIFVYGGGPGPNTVEGNVMWNCGQGIQVVSDAIIRNNIILNSTINGIQTGPHPQVQNIANVEIVNNTIVGHPQCVRLDWGNAQNVTFANNAIYCPGNEAVNVVGGAVNVNGSSNFVQGTVQGAMIDGGLFSDGGTAMAAFVDGLNDDYWLAPNSMLRDAGDPLFAPTLDFNGRTREAPHDVGAYDAGNEDSNPGWAIVGGFKSLDLVAPPMDSPGNNTNTDVGVNNINNANNGGGGGGGGNNNFGGDGERLPLTPRDRDDGCCRTIPKRAGSWWWVALLGCVVGLRRART